ncbi:MAG: NosD domain-containing protein, partial [Thermoplasmatota archaeon]
MRKVSSFVIVFLLLSGIFVINPNIPNPFILENVKARTLYVGGTGQGNFSTIQSAINAANNGDRIIVANGTYNEQIEVNRSIIIMGMSNINTKVIGGFNISKTNVTISGFNITSGYQWDPDGTGLGGYFKSGIRVASNNVSIISTNISSILGGQGGTGPGYIKGGNGGNAYGIEGQYLSNMSLFKLNINNIKGGTGGTGGAYAYGGDGGDSYCIYFTNSVYCSIYSNYINKSSGGNKGLAGDFGSDGFEGEGNGVGFTNVNKSNLHTCHITNNMNYGIVTIDSYNNVFYNNYLNNSNNAYDNGNNKWNTSEIKNKNIIDGPYIAGNFWSDYNGTDLNNDGYGDLGLPFNSSGGIV